MTKLSIKTIFYFSCMLSLLLASCSDSAAPIYQGPDIKFLRTSSAEGLEQEFKRQSYDLKELDHGVPPLILQTLPKDLSNIKSKYRKKQIFFKSLLPMILLANNEIRHERKQILELQKLVLNKTQLKEHQLQQLADLATRYKIKRGALTSKQAFKELLLRADVIPAELALAQAANESAWGTSRFSQLANNLFGEWTFQPGAGIIPEDRPEGATYEVRRFESIYESIRSYLHNLNTHFAYRELRLLRAETRADGQPLDGSKLAEGLFRYSIRGEEYVKDLQSLIRANRLNRFTDVGLRTRG
ncbi:glucosaminidase domain-containing protein [Malonomonas rubra]|uniref:glucosaminidase domain-containing protein n=1 Tax=Malonomonas rubra TaxID=57040 RepID=UPI0026EB44CE|nr:glucosaminidase domain-containing protein [Malonomonas rubra]